MSDEPIQSFIVMKAFLILFCTPFFTFAQEFDVTRFIEANFGELSDSAICRLTLDSLNQDFGQEDRMSWNIGAAAASDDGKLKVYHFAGESCGAYCNPMYQSVVSIDKPMHDSHVFIHTEELNCDLDSIVTIIQGKYYLLFGNHSGRPRGVEGVWGQTVMLCSIAEGFDVIWRFQSTTSSLVDLDSPVSEIYCDPDELTISYSYDWYDELDDFKTYRANGVWKFNGATFEEIERTVNYHTK